MTGMIGIRCRECGQILRAPDAGAARQATCPRCGNIIIVPQKPPDASEAKQRGSEHAAPGSRYSPHDRALLDIPEEGTLKDQDADRTQAVGAVQGNVESPPERKLPWLIDIFLYPTSQAGLITLAVIVLIPAFFGLFVRSLTIYAAVFAPLLVLLTPFACVGLFVGILVQLYLLWYICECIRTSAAGEIRAPETFGAASGLGEMPPQILRAVGCLLVFLAPVSLYYYHGHSTDLIFWYLLVYAVFFLPMGLLSVVMFGSLRGLNPILLISSTLSTLLPYCAMVMTFAAIGLLITRITPPERISALLRFILYCLCIYVSLVVAHILGWFYNRYQELLRWDV